MPYQPRSLAGRGVPVASARKSRASGQDSLSLPPGGTAIQLPDAADGQGDRLVIDTGKQAVQ